MSDSHQNICISCGFCCDGTLFNHAKIKENEPLETGYSFETFIKGTSKNYFFFDASFDTNIYYGFLKT